MNDYRRVPIYPIRTVACLTGVSPYRIRAWEARYHLISPARTEGGHRLYTEEDVERIQWIKAMVERGLSLEEVERLIAVLETADPSEVSTSPVA